MSSFGREKLIAAPMCPNLSIGTLKAESAGAFWNHVKNNYEFARLEDKERKR